MHGIESYIGNDVWLYYFLVSSVWTWSNSGRLSLANNEVLKNRDKQEN